MAIEKAYDVTERHCQRRETASEKPWTCKKIAFCLQCLERRACSLCLLFASKRSLSLYAPYRPTHSVDGHVSRWLVDHSPTCKFFEVWLLDLRMEHTIVSSAAGDAMPEGLNSWLTQNSSEDDMSVPGLLGMPKVLLCCSMNPLALIETQHTQWAECRKKWQQLAREHCAKF